MIELDVRDIKEYHVLRTAILSNTFPWYIEKYGDENTINTFNFLCHIVVRRGEGKIIPTYMNQQWIFYMLVQKSIGLK